MADPASPTPAPQTNGATPPPQTPNIMSSWGPTPVMTTGMTFGEIGQSGLRAFGGWVREEFLPELQGRQAAQKFREMMDNSPTVGALMLAIIATMRKVEWRVNPVNDKPEAQEAACFVESCMDDMSHTWEDLIVENLSMLGYGYAPHEIVYKRRMGDRPGSVNGVELPTSDYDDGKIGWRRIPIRGQDTILKWFFSQNGQITGMTQQPWTGQIVDIPIDKMLLFRPSQHKGNPEGRSILRSSYVSYYYIKRMQEQEAILGERMGGFPVVSVPSALIAAAAAGDSIAVASLNTFKKMATNVRIDEQMGAVMPSDMWGGANGPSPQRMFSFELVTPQGGRGTALNFETAITRYNTAILTSTLADFLTMGHAARGAQNLAETKVDMFFQAIEGFLNSNAAVYNRYALTRLWELNGMDKNLMPSLEPDLAQRLDLDVLGNFVLRLSQSGMPMFPNEDLQAMLLDAGGLPDIQDERALQAAGVTDEQLQVQDDKDMAALERMEGPPVAAPVKPATPLEKMIMASIARRMIRKAGPRFNVSTRKKHSHRHRA